jgi:hypothetical protein
VKKNRPTVPTAVAQNTGRGSEERKVVEREGGVEINGGCQQHIVDVSNDRQGTERDRALRGIGH